MRVVLLLIAMCIPKAQENLRELEAESSIELKLSKHQLVMDEKTTIILNGKGATLEHFTSNAERITIVEIEVAEDGVTVLRIVATTERK